ncbi:MAG: hypothetical protein NWQ54_17825 [Paraglaciecola sp.]|nr:hypothetical protein [Paraglaciecola sp.]
MKIDDNQKAPIQKSSLARRKFLVKGSVAALASTLPLKASWATGNGCSVSGNLSGNQSTICNTTVTGRSPEQWKALKNISPTKEQLQSKWSEIFLQSTVESYRTSSGSLIVDPTLKNILVKAPNSIDAHLVAGYLNALYGFYPLNSDTNAILYAQDLEREASLNQMALINALENTYVGF